MLTLYVDGVTLARLFLCITAAARHDDARRAPLAFANLAAGSEPAISDSNEAEEELVISPDGSFLECTPGGSDLW